MRGSCIYIMQDTMKWIDKEEYVYGKHNIHFTERTDIDLYV